MQRGFTLIEVVVVVAVFAMISTTVLASNSRFLDTIAIKSLAYDIAFSVHQMQTYGLSGKEQTTGSGNFIATYGVLFDSTNSPTSFVTFADRDSNFAYSGSSELVDTYTLTRNARINKLCATSSGVQSCTPSITQVAITFTRPDPDARIQTNAGSTYQSAEIHVISPLGIERVVTVGKTGQISVQ